MNSMTSYAKVAQSSVGAHFYLSIRTLNARFLESSIHLDRALQIYEAPLKKILKTYVERGRVEIHIQVQTPKENQASRLKLNEKVLYQWAKIYRDASKALDLPLSIHLHQLLQMPQVVYQPLNAQRLKLSPIQKQFLFKVFHKLCAKALRERQREGRALKRNLYKLHSQLSRNKVFFRQRHLSLQKSLLSKLKNKRDKKQEAVSLLLEKSDIQEELVRLTEHLNRFKALLDNQEKALGKKLDFYAQELLREVNTIGSKSSCAKLTHKVVESKALIESIREQLQNIE